MYIVRCKEYQNNTSDHILIKLLFQNYNCIKTWTDDSGNEMLWSMSFALIIIIITIIITIKIITITIVIIILTTAQSQVRFSRKTNMKFAVRCEIKMKKNRQPTHAGHTIHLLTLFKQTISI